MKSCSVLKRHLSMVILLRLFPALVLLVVVGAETASSSLSPSSLSRPPFLSHVTDAHVQAALENANSLHAFAVEQALSHYPLDDLSLPPDSALVDGMTFREFTISAPGKLPDFHDQLGQRRIYVTQRPLLTSEECNQVVHDSESWFASHNNGVWTQLPSGSHMVAGFWIKDNPAVYEWFRTVVRTRLFPLLSRTFGDFVSSPEDLCVDNAYLFKYNAETGRRTDVHTDSGCLSFTIALNPSSEYTGGGTWFDGLQAMVEDTKNYGSGSSNCKDSSSVIEMEQGHVTIRPGGVKHCGNAVDSGVRYVIGGFCMHRHKPEPVRQLCAAGTVPNLEAAVILNPHFDPAYNLLAHAYEQQQQRPDSKGPSTTTIQQRKQALEYCLQHIHPYSGGVAYALGSLYHQQHELEAAKSCFLKCLQADAYDVEAMVGLMVLAAELQKPDDEKLYAQRIIATNTASAADLTKAYCNLGVLHTDTDLEIQYYKQAIQHGPTRFAPRYSLGCAYASRQEWVKAVSQFRQALELCPNNATPDETSQALMQLYKVAARQIQNESVGTSPSREQMMQRFAEVMGQAHFSKMVAFSQQQ